MSWIRRSALLGALGLVCTSVIAAAQLFVRRTAPASTRVSTGKPTASGKRQAVGTGLATSCTTGSTDCVTKPLTIVLSQPEAGCGKLSLTRLTMLEQGFTFACLAGVFQEEAGPMQEKLVAVIRKKAAGNPKKALKAVQSFWRMNAPEVTDEVLVAALNRVEARNGAVVPSEVG